MKTMTLGVRWLAIITIANIVALLSNPACAEIINVGPLQFSNADYDNAASQTTGTFRDVWLGQFVNRGNDTFSGDAGTYAALNFNDGVNSQSGGATLYASTPATTNATMFGGAVSIAADVISYEQSNGTSTRLISWYDATNDRGIALVLGFSGNTKSLYLATTNKSNFATTTLPAASATMNMSDVSGFTENTWLRTTLDVSLSDSTFTVSGNVYGHLANDPNALITSLPLGSVQYSGAIAGLQSSGEVGMGFTSGNNRSKASFTNFSLRVVDTPEPGTLSLLGLCGCFWLLRRRWWWKAGA